MSTAVVMDIVDGSVAELTQADGWVFTRIAKVTGVEGTGSWRLKAAIEATNMPAIGSGHPAVAAAKLRRMRCKGDSPSCYEVELYYSQKAAAGGDSSYPALGENPVIEIGGALSEVESNLDYQGNIISVSYTYPNDYINDAYKGQTASQSVNVRRLVSDSSIIFRLTEAQSPESLQPTYQGMLNSAEWRGKGTKTVLCTSITGITTDFGVTYKNQYVFQYRKDGWDTRAVFISPDTGHPPADLVEDTGTKLVQITGTADFNLLFLS
jgi:hypothetical protein